jgi:hypothetical protein
MSHISSVISLGFDFNTGMNFISVGSTQGLKDDVARSTIDTDDNESKRNISWTNLLETNTLP